MQSFYTIADGKIIQSTQKDALIRVFTAPTEEEKFLITEGLGIDSADLDASLDPDEISRIEFLKSHVSIIWKQPYKGSFDLKSQFDVMSSGCFIQKNMLIMILRENYVPFSQKLFVDIESINDLLLRYFFYTIHQYLNHLKAIKQATSKLQGKLNLSMENKYFLQMFDISESLVYYIDAIEANGAVLSKLRANGEKLQFTNDQNAFLDDTIQENTQSEKQAQIYSTVLSGLMDARGNIINNNMNVLLKNLTLINIIFLPLNLIASMGGMSEFSMMLGEYDINWRLGYLFFTLALLVLGWITWISLNKYSNGNGKNKGKKTK